MMLSLLSITHYRVHCPAFCVAFVWHRVVGERRVVVVVLHEDSATRVLAACVGFVYWLSTSCIGLVYQRCHGYESATMSLQD